MTDNRTEEEILIDQLRANILLPPASIATPRFVASQVSFVFPVQASSAPSAVDPASTDYKDFMDLVGGDEEKKKDDDDVAINDELANER